eukprot:1507122-Heterocapsa_arctica.AAC.1
MLIDRSVGRARARSGLLLPRTQSLPDLLLAIMPMICKECWETGKCAVCQREFRPSKYAPIEVV